MEELPQGFPWDVVPIGSVQSVSFQGQTTHGRITSLEADENFIGLVTPDQVSYKIHPVFLFCWWLRDKLIVQSSVLSCFVSSLGIQADNGLVQFLSG